MMENALCFLALLEMGAALLMIVIVGTSSFSRYSS